MPDRSGTDEPQDREEGTQWSTSRFDPRPAIDPTTDKPSLRAMPDESTPDRRSPVARWVMTLSEPLLSTERRMTLDTDMAAFIASNHQWAVYWFTGSIADIVSTLPANDPWRHLSASIDLTMISMGESSRDAEARMSFQNPRGQPAPGGTRAVFPDGRTFGSPADSADLVLPDIGPPESDIGLVALTEPLGDLSSAIGGFATADVEFFCSALGQVWHHLWIAEFSGGTSVSAGSEFLRAVAPVLRRFIHRRRLYTGQDDPFPTLAAFSWMARADRLISGPRRISAELGLAQEAVIEPEAYDDLRA